MKLGITGYPLLYTKSPALHRGFLRQAKRKGSYDVHPFDPKKGKKAFFRFLDRLREEGTIGLNVTMPFKEWAFEYAQGTTRDFSGRCAKLLGSANTLVFGKRVLAANTDTEGFWGEIGEWLGSRRFDLLVVGTGGAAKGVVAGILAKHPAAKGAVCVRVWGRNATSASKIGRKLPTARRKKYSGEIPLLVAWCVPPMSAVETKRTLGKTGLTPGQIVFFYDLNYGERSVATRKIASSKKWRISKWREGSGMLKRQARASFSIWKTR